MLSLISDALDLSKIEADKLELQHLTLSAASLVRELQFIVDAANDLNTVMNLDSIRFAPATILIADDIDYNSELLTIFLQKQPFDILEATGGAETIDKARTHRRTSFCWT